MFPYQYMGLSSYPCVQVLNSLIKEKKLYFMFFELEDIRRRHTLYSDIFNVGVWVEAPDK